MFNMTNQALKLYSIEKGMIVPEFHDPNCGCYSKFVSKVIARNHRNKAVNDLVKEYFNIYMDEVEIYETELLKVLGLPSLNAVRADFASKQVDEVYVAPENWQGKTDAVLKGWYQSIALDPDKFPTMALTGYSIGLQKTQERIIMATPADKIDEVRINAIFAQPSSESVQRIVTQGQSRLKTKTLVDFQKIINQEIITGVANNQTPMYIARQIHRRVGEGRAWDWLRFTRSEIVLAYERAYNDQANKQGINYDRWSTSSNPCLICSPLNNHVWKRGEGPEPVSNTHPNCYCIRIPLFTWSGTIQNKWNIESPYGKGMKIEIGYFHAMHIQNEVDRLKALEKLFQIKIMV